MFIYVIHTIVTILKLNYMEQFIGNKSVIYIIASSKVYSKIFVTKPTKISTLSSLLPRKRWPITFIGTLLAKTDLVLRAGKQHVDRF